MNLWPYRWIGGSGATVFGVPVYGEGRGRLHPIMVLSRLFYSWDRRVRLALRYRLIRKHRYHLIDTGLPPGYYDEDTRMLHGCMALLCHFVEWHGGADKLDAFTGELRGNPDPNAPEGLGGHQINTQSEAVEIYRWWTIGRPANHKRLDEWCSKLFGGGLTTRPVEINGQTLHEIVFDNSDDRDAECHRYWDFERQLDNDDQRMLHRLVDIRPGLWT